MLQAATILICVARDVKLNKKFQLYDPFNTPNDVIAII